MTLHRLAKDEPGSVTSGGCPALYSTDDPARMICQGKVLAPEQTMTLAGGCTAADVPAETVFLGAAKYATEHGDDELSSRLEAFLAGTPDLCGAGRAQMTFRGKALSPAESAQLLEVLDDETAVEAPTGVVFRCTAEYATEHGDDELASLVEAFLAARGL